MRKSYQYHCLPVVAYVTKYRIVSIHHIHVFSKYIYTDMKSHAMIFMRQYHKNQLETVL